MVEKFLALVLILLLSPFLLVLSLVIVLCDGWPFWFVQKRVGYQGVVFDMWKFRTMVIGAENQKTVVENKNEADGPVFKIRNDPRFTKLGKFLSHTGIDEVLQILNIVTGNMSIVGPRPLPVAEAKNIPKKYEIRNSVKPGIISPWVFDGYHSLGFEEWMESDMRYVKNKSVVYDLFLCWRGGMAFGKMIVVEIANLIRR